MTIRKNIHPALATAITSALVVSLSGCGMINSVLEQDKLDYRGTKKQPKLEVPPDLTQLEKDNRYAIPEGRGSATASTFGQRAAAPAMQGEAVGQVGPVSVDGMRVERAGNQRWLVVNRTPEQLWPELKRFWADNGFDLVTESLQTGTMETEWLEDRSKIPQDAIRRTIGKVAPNLYSSDERNKFRTRVERTANGTEIYISHRGAQEVLTGPAREFATWTTRPNDPNLEAIYISKLMASLSGAPEAKPTPAIETKVAQAVVTPQRAKVVGGAVQVEEGFDRAWRRVGLALDRVGFTVEDRDRVQGVYFVRYVDPEVASKDGFFKKLFTFGGDDKAKEAQRYRVLVKTESGASISQVTVQTNDGKAETTPTGAKILKLLAEELK